jgi:hypothetical protein
VVVDSFGHGLVFGVLEDIIKRIKLRYNSLGAIY